MTLYCLNLTTEKHQTLKGWRKKYNLYPFKLRQTQVLPNIDKHTGRRASAVPGNKTVERVRRQFYEEGPSLFAPKICQTRSDKKIVGCVETHLTNLVCQSPPYETSTWHLRVLTARFMKLKVVEHTSTAMVARLLKKQTQAILGVVPMGDSGRVKCGPRQSDGVGARPLQTAL